MGSRRSVQAPSSVVSLLYAEVDHAGDWLGAGGRNAILGTAGEKWEQMRAEDAFLGRNVWRV